MPDETFWRLTPAELFGLVKRAEAEREIKDFRSAQICCILANANRDQKKRKTPYKVKDFMPSYGEKEAPITNRGKESLRFFEQIIIPRVNKSGVAKRRDKNG